MNVESMQETNKRSGEEILYNVFSLCEEGSLKTQVMYKCNLSFTQLNNNLRIGVRGNYLKADDSEKGRIIYTTTRKGNLLVNIYDLLYLLSTTGGEVDPYKDDKLKDAIKEALSPLTSVNSSLEKLFKEQKIPKLNIINFKHRGPESIIEDILDKATGGIKKTNLMYGCNITFKQTNTYTSKLSDANMLSIIERLNGIIVETTDKGGIYSQLHKLGRYLLETGEDSDPFKNENSPLFAQIEATLSPVRSMKIPKEADIILPQPIVQRK
jgi:predicted transcriptional regulator